MQKLLQPIRRIFMGRATLFWLSLWLLPQWVQADDQQAARLAAYQAMPSLLSAKAVSSLMTDVGLAGDKLVAVGERGHILASDDQGKSWQQVKSPVQALLTGVDFVNPQQGWAVGHDGLILHTADAGQTWQIQHVHPYVEPDPDAPFDYNAGPDTSGQPLLDLYFKNMQQGFAVGAYGMFLHTVDGGKHWQDWSKRLNNIDAWHLNAIAGVGERLVVAGEMGTLFRSDDDGETWQRLNSPYQGSFFGILMSENPDQFWVFGLQGRIFRTRDGGQTWQAIETANSNSLMAGIILTPEKLVFAGNGGVLLVSEDGGEHFSAQFVDDRQSIVSVTQNKQHDLVVAGKSGVKIRTIKPTTSSP